MMRVAIRNQVGWSVVPLLHLLCILGLPCVASFSISEREWIQGQLGYVPSNFLHVSAWTKSGSAPVAIKTYPLDGGAKRRRQKAKTLLNIGTPFPTLFWLTNPDLSAAIANLERQGYIQKLESRIRSDPELCSQFQRCHHQYAQERWNTLEEDDKKALMVDDPTVCRMKKMLKESGVAGLRSDGSVTIKCLHSHYAHYRSTKDKGVKNPVGLLLHPILLEKFPDLDI